MARYKYNGPVLIMNKVVDESWKGETYAVSYKKAVNNLCYQFKKEYGFVDNTKVTLAKSLILS